MPKARSKVHRIELVGLSESWRCFWSCSECTTGEIRFAALGTVTVISSPRFRFLGLNLTSKGIRPIVVKRGEVKAFRIT